MTLKADPGAFASFIEYMEEHSGAKSECDAPPQKKQRSDTGGEDMCKICFTRPIDCVLVPCGHFFACMICAERLDDLAPFASRASPSHRKPTALETQSLKHIARQREHEDHQPSRARDG